DAVLPEGTAEEVATALADLRQAMAEVRQEVEQRWVASELEAGPLRKVLSKVFEGASNALVSENKAMRELEAENMRVVNSRGDLPVEAAAEYEKKRKSYEALQRALSSLADALSRPMPELAED
ncbi:uncharacterized protein HaLaN_32562, partial [Haematococcus lacustris]